MPEPSRGLGAAHKRPPALATGDDMSLCPLGMGHSSFGPMACMTLPRAWLDVAEAMLAFALAASVMVHAATWMAVGVGEGASEAMKSHLLALNRYRFF